MGEPTPIGIHDSKSTVVVEPFPISLVANRFLIYNVDVVSHIRVQHHMCGCLTGTLSAIPQQNVFLGLPLELMVEEATLLVEKDAAYIVDDALVHGSAVGSLLEADKQIYIAQISAKQNEIGRAHQAVKDADKKKAIDKAKAKGETWTKKFEDLAHDDDDMQAESLFGAGRAVSEGLDSSPASMLSSEAHFHVVLPTSSSLSTYKPQPPAESFIPQPDPARYSVYKALHAKGYFLSPGLRFGCQFLAYPGDPLRYHSHFIADGFDWAEKVPVMDLVGGGRLGTGVKKAWLIGGDPNEALINKGIQSGKDENARMFCVEWAGFG